MRAARSKTRLEDFGSSSFVEPLQCLIDSINETGDLHAFGRAQANAMLERMLCSRLEIEREWQADARAREFEIEPPVVILGLPRSGSTFLQELLACDAGHRSLTSWEAQRPVPPEGRWSRSRAARRLRGRANIAIANHLAPALRVIHEMKLDGPDECGSLLMHSFAFWGFPMLFDVPDYVAWLEGYDFTDSLAYHRRILRLLSSQRPVNRWLLKCPAHLGAIDALVATYPDARLVQTHRDPAKVVPSECSFFAAGRSVAMDALDGPRIGRQVVELLATLTRRSMESRARLEPDAVFDVVYADLIADPIGVVGALYRHHDLPFRPEFVREMERYIGKVAQGRWQMHRYDGESFGLEEHAIRDAFKFYYDAFGVSEEAA